MKYLNKIKTRNSFSKPQLLIFLLVFGAIGILVWKSLAAPNPNLPGDLNNDNTVNVTDLSILLSNYGTSNSNSDINNDGTVNILDLSILLSHYGQSATTGTPIQIGETNILTTDDWNNAGNIIANQVTLSQAATLQSLSIYVTQAAGTVRLGVYDSTGPNGAPGNKLAETGDITTTVGWDTGTVSPVSMNAGNYWLAYVTSDNNQHTRIDNNTGNTAWYNYPYGSMPAIYSTTATRATGHASLYATFSTTGTPPPPPPGCTDPTMITDRLFTCASVWNTPIPSNVAVHPDSAAMMADTPWVINTVTDGHGWLGARYGFNPGDNNHFSLSVQYAPTGTPLVPLVVDYPSCGASTTQVPIPAGTEVSGGSGENTFALLTQSGDEYDFFDITPPNAPTKSLVGGCPTSNAWHLGGGCCNQLTGANGWKGAGDAYSGVRGYASNLVGGVIRPRDAQQSTDGTWGHAIAIRSVYTCAAGQTHPSYIYPAHGSDGTHAGTSCIPEGARVQMSPSVNCATWASIQATNLKWMQALCKTAQVYGLIVVDTGASMDYQGWNLGSYVYPWGNCSILNNECTLPADLMRQFRVIDWTQWTH